MEHKIAYLSHERTILTFLTMNDLLVSSLIQHLAFQTMAPVKKANALKDIRHFGYLEAGAGWLFPDTQKAKASQM